MKLCTTTLLLATLAGGLLASACDQRPRIPYEPPPTPSGQLQALVQHGAGPQSVRELRGVWITNVDSDVLLSKDRIAEAMEFLADMNINVVYPVVWNKAVTLYPSQVMKETFGVEIDPLYEGRDPLAELIAEAHRHGIEVIPWFEYGFAASYNLDGGPLLEAKPHWAAVDKDGNLVKKNNFEWMNAFDPEVREFLASLILEVAGKYDVDGIQGDDRLPAVPSSAGYDEATRSLYLELTGNEAPDDEKDPDWVRWRADILTDWLAELRERVKAVDENLIISMSPSYYDWALYEYLQDSYTWTNRGLVDTIHPQAYRYNIPAYQSIVDDFVENQFTEEQLELLSPGVLIKVGSYRISVADLLEKIAINREAGINGEVHFFYEGLREQDNELAHALREGPYAAPAALPYRENHPWRPGALERGVLRGDLPDGWAPLEGHPGFLAAPGGTDTVLSYDVEVPVAASYHVYAKLPEAGVATASEATYGITDGRNLTAKLIEQASPHNAGWVYVGTMELHPGSGQNTVTLTPLEGDPERRTVAGPLMLLLNRRESPAVVWN